MPNRREFLKRISSYICLAGLPVSLRSAPAAKEISLGYSLYGMKTLPLQVALSETARIGYSNVEICLLRGFPTELANLDEAKENALRDQLRSTNLRPSSLLININLAGDEATFHADLETIKRAGSLAHKLDPEHPPILQSGLGGKSAEWETLKETMAARLHSWGAAAKSVGATIAIKGHVSNAVDTPERLLWLYKQAPSSSIAIAFDHSHYELAGIPLVSSLAILGPYIRFIHVKDINPKPEETMFLPPGKGTTDYREYFRLLRKMGYQGPAVVEISSQIFNKPNYSPIAVAEQCYSALSSALNTG